MQDVVIVAATRTAVGSFQGSLVHVPAVDLGAAVIRQLLEKPVWRVHRSMKSSWGKSSPRVQVKTRHARQQSRPDCHLPCQQ